MDRTVGIGCLFDNAGNRPVARLRYDRAVWKHGGFFHYLDRHSGLWQNPNESGTDPYQFRHGMKRKSAVSGYLPRQQADCVINQVAHLPTTWSCCIAIIQFSGMRVTYTEHEWRTCAFRFPDHSLFILLDRHATKNLFALTPPYYLIFVPPPNPPFKQPPSHPLKATP